MIKQLLASFVLAAINLVVQPIHTQPTLKVEPVVTQATLKVEPTQVYPDELQAAGGIYILQNAIGGAK